MSELKKYHYNTITNRMNQCNADVKDCPLGGVPHVEASNNMIAKGIYEHQYKNSMKNESYLGRKRSQALTNHLALGRSTRLPNDYLEEFAKDTEETNALVGSYYRGSTLKEIRNNVVKDYEELVRKHPRYKDFRYTNQVFNRLKSNINDYFIENRVESDDFNKYKAGSVFKNKDGSYYREFTYEYTENTDLEVNGYKPPFENIDENEHPFVGENDVTEYYEYYDYYDDEIERRFKRFYSYEIKNSSIFNNAEDLKKISALQFSYDNIKNRSLPDWMVLPPRVSLDNNNISMSKYLKNSKELDDMKKISNNIHYSRASKKYMNIIDTNEYYDMLIQDKNLPANLHNKHFGEKGNKTFGDALKANFIRKISYSYPSDNENTRLEKAKEFVERHPDSVRKNIEWMADGYYTMMSNIETNNEFIV